MKKKTMKARHMNTQPHHHPSDELLMDYASGALGEGWSLGIATHLAMCPLCRQKLNRIEGIGGSLLEDQAPAAVSDDMFASVMAEIEGLAPIAPRTPVANDSGVLPSPLRRYLGGDIDEIKWKRLGLGAYQCEVATHDGTSVRLLRIPAGKPVPEHTHRGLELTVVLQGAFTDHSGEYARGDFEEADEQMFHQPHAVAGEDCICLAITDAPLRFTSLAARIAQPILGI